MYQSIEWNAHDVAFVAIACSGFPMEQGCHLIETIKSQTKEDRTHVLAMAATLASFVGKVIPKMKYYDTEARQRVVADDLSKRNRSPADRLVFYELMARILFDEIRYKLTSFCKSDWAGWGFCRSPRGFSVPA
jgi:hypothetical protein